MNYLQQMNFENIVAEEEFAHKERYLLLPQCFQLLFNNDTFIYGYFLYFYLDKFKSRLLGSCCMWERDQM